jgi:ADP-heptose:LPS heptosyltransferase
MVMLNYFFKLKTKNIHSLPPSIKDIQQSRKILFSVFSRYGDTIIDLVVIREFIELYPDKEYLIICPHQMKPYVKEILSEVECFAFNKRNIFEMLKVINLLKRRSFDIGFNPWSNGLDSCYFLTFCRQFLFYKDFNKPIEINHYQVVRRYLMLQEKPWFINKLKLKQSYKIFLICPESTDSGRSMNSGQIDITIKKLNELYNSPEIIIAALENHYFRPGCEKFIFNKTAESSRKFLRLIKKSEMLICVDSGPLHIALALNKDLTAIMKSTIAQTVINTGSSLVLKTSK